MEYVTEDAKRSRYWNIPIANTTCLLLGTGTSITQAAVRELARAGVLVGFCGGDGTPLYSANECQLDFSWFCPQSEYRPTTYLQKWVSFWFDDALRLEAAKSFQLVRLDQIEKHWLGSTFRRNSSFTVSQEPLKGILDGQRKTIERTGTVRELMAQEGMLTKTLYRIISSATGYGHFSRAKRGSGIDCANRFLDYGNYLAYGLGATAAWVLGIPHGLAVLHGKTRRGALVFDIADIIKDALVLPTAFLSAVAGESDQSFRTLCIDVLRSEEALDVMIETVQETALRLGK